MNNKEPFSSYQVFILVGLALLLFTVVLDYMLLPALSATLLESLELSTEQFGLISSVYALSAGISAFVISGYADRFDRKSFLLIFYGGFIIGLILCALAPSFEILLVARIVTGIFGGVIASISYAIVTDLFELNQRGRAMGYLQMAFAAGLILGLPLALYLSANSSWQLTYWLIAALGVGACLLVAVRMKRLFPQKTNSDASAWSHLYKVTVNARHWTVFSNNMLIVGGDVMLMTFNAAYMVNNLKLTDDQLPAVYGAMGLTSLVFAPLFGKLADRVGKFYVFIAGSVIALIVAVVYTHQDTASLWEVVSFHVVLFLGINARMVSSAALATAIPTSSDRGAFMSVDASAQQLAGGAAAALAGLIVFQNQESIVLNYPSLGWAVVAAILLSMLMMYRIHLLVRNQ